MTLDATHSYINTLFEYQPDDTVTIGFLRDWEEMEVDVALGGS